MKKHIIILSIFTILTIVSTFFIFQVKTNYDLSVYLPSDSNTSQALKLYEEEFGENTMIQVMIDDVTVAQAIALKEDLSEVKHVSQTIWLDNYVDLNTVPIEYIPNQTLEQFYVDNNALITIVLDLDTYSTELDQVVLDIQTLLDDYQVHLRGDSLIEMANRNLASHETFKIMLIIVPIVLVLLLLTSVSWFDPVIAIISIGVAVVLNLGTNALLPDISFITKTMALALQLALSIDYTLFFLHRYHELRETLDKNQAITQALKKTFPAITASALTTFAGFLALLFMQYKIGFDIGIVLSKGIILSYLVVLTLIPTIIYLCDKWLIKGVHKQFIRTPKGMLKTIYKLRIPFLAIFIIFLFSFFLESKTEYLYGQNQSLDENSEVAIDLANINQYFDQYQQMVILIPNNYIENEVELVTNLEANIHVISVETLVTLVDPNIPRAFIDPTVISQYVGNNYTRIILQTDILEENDEMYAFVDDIYQTIEQTYGTNYYVLGVASTASDIRNTVTADYLKIMLISIIAIYIILAITFKNPIIPIFLILVIESAIAVNISILYLLNIQTIYIGYLVVMSIQLGATIDYAVLLTTRYLENRKTLPKYDALHESYQKTLITMMVSALILSVAGFAEGLFSNISTIQDIGFLLGKGTLISFVFTMIFVPVLLIIFDKLFMKTMLKKS
ncbi:MAG: MMPL family transporter [Acholeplasmataceae bacterium]